jgi:hypothetical protein
MDDSETDGSGTDDSGTDDSRSDDGRRRATASDRVTARGGTTVRACGIVGNQTAAGGLAPLACRLALAAAATQPRQHARPGDTGRQADG